MAVVLLIAAIALVAVPVASRAMRENRSSSAAQSIAMLYQLGRARAIGRGVAVLVRFSSTEGKFEVFEATGGASSFVPLASCSMPPDRWTDGSQHVLVDALQFNGQAPYEQVMVEFAVNTVEAGHGVGGGSTADVCFTPSGAMMYREGDTVFTSAPRTLAIRVVRATSPANEIGISRTVFILPNGVTRIASPVGPA